MRRLTNHHSRVLFLIPLVFALGDRAHAQNVGINDTGAPPNPYAVLDVDIATNNKGIMVPRLTTAQRTSIAGLGATEESLMVYDTTTDSFWYWDGTQWVEVQSKRAWLLQGNTGTTPGTDFLGTTDAQDLVVKTAGTEAMRVTSAGRVGIGTPAPAHKVQVNGDVRIVGDFVNQDAVGAVANAVQNIPFTNGTFNPINGTVTSITVVDGSGVNNSAVFISGFARTFGGLLNGSSSSMGGYFLILQRDVTAAFAAPVNLTYTSGICYLKTPNGLSTAAIGFGGGGEVSYLDSGLAPGTYYYRLVLYPNGVGITSGTYDIYERSLSVLELKR
ncbi:MAG: hypothetical protein ABI432_10090 [Flavobacteriales bacterium]